MINYNRSNINKGVSVYTLVYSHRIIYIFLLGEKWNIYLSCSKGAYLLKTHLNHLPFNRLILLFLLEVYAYSLHDITDIVNNNMTIQSIRELNIFQEVSGQFMLLRE